MIEHRAFFGDGEKTFAFPTRDLIEELQRKTGQPIGAIFRRFRTGASPERDRIPCNASGCRTGRVRYRGRPW